MMLRNTASKIDEYLDHNRETKDFFLGLILGQSKMDGNALVDQHFDPMIAKIYKDIQQETSASTLTEECAEFYIKEISVFARYNSQFLRRASQTLLGFCSELSHELMRNHLEEGGERGKLPAHYIVFTSALIKDLGLMVNGHVPQLTTTKMLVWLHHVLVNSHCPSTLLGMYYATEAVAIAETRQLNLITDQLGRLRHNRSGADLPNLHFYFNMHLDEDHGAATEGKSVEQGHQDGIARFIREHDTFNFQLPLIIDGFLQMLGVLVDQWTELHLVNVKKNAEELICSTI